MPAIRILPAHTVNRIAAGEVIERPAAAVKELVENALDAGAARIAVALEGGGIDRIEVTDDGCGMDAAGLALSVLRHATSKLLDDDLVRIATLGFRGEALPSIGAAARLAITSRPREAAHASEIRVEGGRLTDVAPAAGAPGTRVVVQDLFFATPARRKFLKQPRTEADHAETVVRRLALAAPSVAFRLECDGRVAFDLPPQERADRVAALFGREAAEAMVEVGGERGDLRIAGFACSPAVTRATGAAQALTVNGRPVADPVLKGAVRVAYRDVIAAGRQPVVALWLDLPPEELDVNVHPAKTELRFRDVGAVRSLVIGSLQRALAGGAGTSLPAPRPALHLQYSRPSPMPYRSVPLPGMAEAPLAFGASPAARMLPVAEPRPEHPLGAPVAQVLDTYVIAVAADGSLVLVDQHAAHERLTHEALREQMLDGGVRSQPLLLPAVVDMPPADASRLLARSDELHRLGLEIEAFGPGAVMVRALPAPLGAPDPGPLLRDLADELEELDEATALAARLDAVIARLACHGSIRAGRRLNGAEMDALLRQMEATPRAATCSHGRPTFLKLTKAEIEKLFGRR
ncbi:MAG TPA: DNA mismatch repair endonuclease MutL [Acetobacteraceae bacterium]|jgi:DNA mismatch repair protein MutL|nr:DNA mismatch repair endonuclease MutL [Acetobacteraceae bacterium]